MLFHFGECETPEATAASFVGQSQHEARRRRSVSGGPSLDQIGRLIVRAMADGACEAPLPDATAAQIVGVSRLDIQ
jgi:hypothetical protein